MEPKCRSCEIDRSMYVSKLRYHTLLDVGLYCPLCNFSGTSIYHPENNELAGNSIECINCHNYIIYDSKGTILKDEIYFPNNNCLIRSLENLQSYYLINDKNTITFPHIVQFTDYGTLLFKLKSFMVYL